VAAALEEIVEGEERFADVSSVSLERCRDVARLDQSAMRWQFVIDEVLHDFERGLRAIQNWQLARRALSMCSHEQTAIISSAHRAQLPPRLPAELLVAIDDENRWKDRSIISADRACKFGGEVSLPIVKRTYSDATPGRLNERTQGNEQCRFAAPMRADDCPAPMILF